MWVLKRYVSDHITCLPDLALQGRRICASRVTLEVVSMIVYQRERDHSGHPRRRSVKECKREVIVVFIRAGLFLRLLVTGLVTLDWMAVNSNFVVSWLA